VSKKPSLPGVDAIFGSVPSAPPMAEKKAEPARKEREQVVRAPVKKPVEAPAQEPSRETSSDLSAKDPSNDVTAEYPAVDSQKTSDNSIVDEEDSEAVGGETPHKVTLYILPSVEEKLEETWYRLRRRRRDKLPKWRIVNAILEKYLPDLDQLEKLLGK